MVEIAIRILIGGSACLGAVALRYWHLSSRYEVGVRRGKALLIASLLGGSGVCAAGLALSLYESHLIVFEIEGKIEGVEVRRGKTVRPYLYIHTTAGDDIVVHASGMSPYFRRRQSVRLRYQDKTGEILTAIFLAGDGHIEAVFNDSETWPSPYFIALVGATIGCSGLTRYYRDPQGSKYPTLWDPVWNTSVDKASLLNLSNH